MVKNAVICAAGLGSRLGFDMPKCLVEIGEHKLIYYLLKSLENVENIRIVVGFKEKQVIDYVKNIRPDVLFIRNPDFRNTSNSYSLYLGTHDLQESFLTIDGDMIVDYDSLQNFMENCEEGVNSVGITQSKTDDAVFVNVQDNQVTQFSRETDTGFEWSGVAFLKNGMISKQGKYVYQELEAHLPIKIQHIECFEIDTPGDLMHMRKNLHNIKLP